MENAFYVTLKASFVLKIITFLSWIFRHVGKRLYFQRKLSLFSKFVTSSTEKQIIAIDILLNISRNEGNQAMKFSQLIEYNMRNIFLEKSCGGDVVEKLVPEPSVKNQNCAYLWIKILKFYAVSFLCSS